MTRTGSCSAECTCPGCLTVRFFAKHLTHARGELGGKPFVLQPWQADYIRTLFGTLRPDGMRQYRTSALFIGRKNGKSTLAAGIAIRLLFDKEPGAEIYSCAASRDQARLVFDVAKIAVEQSPALRSRLKVYRNAIVREETHSTYRCTSAEAFNQHGLSAHGVVFDELAQQPSRELWDVMTSSQGARRQPLTVALSTAGWDRKSIGHEVWRYAEAVACGAVKDPTFLPLIFSAPEKADWKDEKTWALANPNLGVSIKLDFLRSECARAAELPAYENTFRTLYLSQWVEQSTRWLPMDKWAKGIKACPVNLEGRECFGGLDLASTYDTSSLVLLFDLGDGTFWAEPHFWIPEDNMRDRVRRDRVPYDVWAKQGLIHTTPGNVTDYDQIRADIDALGKKYAIRQIAIDRWNATQLAGQLQGLGYDVVGFGQGYASLSAPSKRLETLVLGGRLYHNSAPLTWQAGNVAIQQDNAAGNIKPSKNRSTERIDGIVALVMALGIHATATAPPPEQSWDILAL